MMVWDWKLFFEGVETFATPLAAASWPIAIGLIALMFRKNIADAIGRIRAVRTLGSEADFDARAADQNPEENILGKARPETISLPGPSTNPQLAPVPPDIEVYRPVESHLQEQLEIAFPEDVNAQLRWALRRYAGAEVERFHEANYRIMFGSQLSALNHLNQLSPASKSSLERFFEEFTSSDLYEIMTNKMDFEQWMSFLKIRAYVNEENGDYSITPLGKDFLSWIVGRGINQYRPG